MVFSFVENHLNYLLLIFCVNLHWDLQQEHSNAGGINQFSIGKYLPSTNIENNKSTANAILLLEIEQ